MVAKGSSFTVTVGKQEAVAAVLPMQEHWLPQSNLDLLLPPLHFTVFFCYKRPEAGPTSFGPMVGLLKKALAQALVSYYALAGELVQNSVGEPELLCNNRGVDFIVGYADVELENLDLHNPDESIEGKLVPKKKHGVLCVQATELKCGGIVVACTFDHRVSDAYSANMFLVSWAEMARSTSLSLLPSFRRSLLNPRHPGFYSPYNDNLYIPLSSLSPSNDDCPNNQDHLISRIYYIKAESLLSIQTNAPKSTKLEAFCAFLWKMVAASEADRNKICKMGLVVDGRLRLKGEDKPMETYFGNVLSIPFGQNRVEEMHNKPLDWVAEQVHEFVSTATTKDHFLDLIDWVEAHRPEPALSRIYATGSEGPSFVVSSGRRFPIEKVDFGWGKPVFGSYHFPWGGETGYVMPLPSPMGGCNEDWIVYMHMMKGQLEWLEKEANDVFKPLTFDYFKAS